MFTSNFPSDICKSSGVSMNDCGTYWSAWSAVATGFAGFIALVAIFYTIYDNWRRRCDENRDKIAVIREVCSAVDQILAYYEISVSLATGNFAFLPAVVAIDRIKYNVTTLNQLINLLRNRVELTDGAVFIAVAIQPISEGLCRDFRKPDGDMRWPLFLSNLHTLNSAATLVAMRSALVRKHAGLKPSTTAKAIRDKYNPLIAAMGVAMQTQQAPIVPDIMADHY